MFFCIILKKNCNFIKIIYNDSEMRIVSTMDLKNKNASDKNGFNNKNDSNSKHDLVNATIKMIQKNHGKESIRCGNTDYLEIEAIPTGSLALDIALSIGGFPMGRIIEIYGPESSGKTTLALHTIAECQKRGGIAALVDTEHAFDSQYAKKIGVNIEELITSQPDFAEQALEIVEALARSHAVGVIVVDSVAALVPKVELEGDMGDSHMGVQARLMSQALRKLTPIISKSNCIVIFINQIRHKIGVMFGSPETTTGGNALKFYSSVRLDVRKTGSIKKGEEVVGNQVKIKVAKNKVGAPFRNVDIEIMYGLGISKISEIINIGVNLNLIQKSGSWYSINDNKIGQGVDSVKSFFENNAAIVNKLEEDIRKTILDNRNIIDHIINSDKSDDIEDNNNKYNNNEVEL